MACLQSDVPPAVHTLKWLAIKPVFKLFPSVCNSK